MPLSKYLTAGRACLLKGRTPEEVMGELTDLICLERTDLDRDTVLEAVIERERDVGTQIAPAIALPHARLPGVGRPVLAVGVSRNGVPWGGAEQGCVHLVILLLGDQTRPQEHLEALADVGSVFQAAESIEPVLSATSSADLYAALTAFKPFRAVPVNEARRLTAQRLYRRACELTTDTDAACLVLMADDDLDLSFADADPPACRSVLVTSERRKLDASSIPFDHVVQVPMRGMMQRHALDLALLVSVSKGMIGLDDTVVCLYGGAQTVSLDTLSLLSVREDLRIPLSLRDEIESGQIDFQVLLRVFTLATELAREGREGRSVGTIFVLGDYEGVQPRCHQLVMNPFKGYADEERNIMDPSLAETVKEFSHMDGAFAVRGDGVIMSAGSYIRSEVIGDQLASGLGARHAAGQAITACTKALSIVVSESTGAISLFKNGRSVLTLRRDDS